MAWLVITALEFFHRFDVFGAHVKFCVSVVTSTIGVVVLDVWVIRAGIQ